MQVRAEGRERRVEAVRLAAAQLFRDQGYEPTTVRQIAAAAGVSTGTVMSCGGKATLLLQTVEDAITSLMPTLPPAAETRDPVEAIWRCFAPYFEFYASVPGLARPYTVLLLTGDPRHPALGAQAETFTAVLAHQIRAGFPTAGADAARLTAEALFAAYLHALLRWVTGVAELNVAAEQLHRQIDWQLSRFPS